MIVKLLIEHHLEFLSLKGGCRGSSESTLVKMSNCWKSFAAAQMRPNASFVTKPNLELSIEDGNETKLQLRVIVKLIDV